MQPIIKQGWLRVLIFLVCLLVIILFAARATLLIYSIISVTGGENKRSLSPEQLLYTGLVISAIASYLTVLFFRKIVDRQTVHSLGLQWQYNQPHAAAGFFLGLFLLGAGTLLLVATGTLEWTDINFDARSVFINLGLMVIIAFTEELVFRGYVLNNLMQSLNKWTALLVSALVFAFFHSNNPGIHPIAIANLFIGGIVLGINYIYTRNLWFSIFFHFSWNFFQGSVLGYDVSGINMQSLLQHDLSGNAMLTGGAFGFEGSVISGILCLIGAGVLFWVYQRKSLKSIKV